MPIVAKAELQARRAAAQAAAAQASAPPAPASATIQVRSRVRRPEARSTVPPPALPAAASLTEPAIKRRGHAVKDENGKWQPTGDYAHGWSRPPEATRFKKGGKPGPGRPKGSVSHDALLKRQLDKKQSVRVNGREKQLTVRELLITKAVMAAVEGKDRDARKYVLSESARLYAASAEAAGGPAAGPELTASDLLSVEEYEADLRATIRAEIEAELARKTEGEK